MGNNDDDMSGMQKMFELFKNQNRYKRDTDLYDLGDKLVEKLEMAKDAFQAKAGNISCYLQEFNYIDDDMNLNLQGMLQEADSYDWQGNEWLHEKNKQGIKDCYDMVQSIPKNLLEHYGNEKREEVHDVQRPHDEDGVHVRRRQEDAGEALQATLRARPGDRHGRDEPSQDDPHARRGLHGLLNQLDHHHIILKCLFRFCTFSIEGWLPGALTLGAR